MAFKSVKIDKEKFDYIFGKVFSNRHNADRSSQLALQMKRLGVPDTQFGHDLLTKHFDNIVKQPNNVIETFSKRKQHFELRESLFAGPSGQFAKFQIAFEIMLDGTRRFTTLVIKDGMKKVKR